MRMWVLDCGVTPLIKTSLDVGLEARVRDGVAHDSRKYMRDPMVRRAVVSLAVLCSLGGAALQARAQAPTVDWSNHRLTIAAADVPLAVVLAEVARRTGSKVAGLEQASRRVTIDIRNATLLDAVRAILREVDLDYIYIPRFDAREGAYDQIALWLYGPSRVATARVPCGPGEAGECGPVAVTVVAYDDTATGMPQPSADAAEEAELVTSGHFDFAATEGGLLSLTKSGNHGVRIRAIQALALQNTAAGHAAIRAAINDEHPFVRAEAAELLAHTGRPEDGARELLAHQDPAVRFAGAVTLSDDQSESATLQLERALGDEDGGVRTIAADVLRQKARQSSKRR